MDSLSYNYLFIAYFCVTLLNLCFTIRSVIQYTLITAFCDPYFLLITLLWQYDLDEQQRPYYHFHNNKA